MEKPSHGRYFTDIFKKHEQNDEYFLIEYEEEIVTKVWNEILKKRN